MDHRKKADERNKKERKERNNKITRESLGERERQRERYR
jgi:hypothetical protein